MERRERRGCRRFKMSWPISVMQDERELAHGETANISRSGAYFRSAVGGSLEPGMRVSILIDVPPTDESITPLKAISGEARVVRLDEQAGGCGIALHFSEEFAPFSESSAGEP